MSTTYRFLAPLTDIELANVIGNRLISANTKAMARLMLTTRLAYAQGDYYTAAQTIAAMKKVA